ncbi:hypothetical protein TRICI_002079 [Trichomonascus ciferrii]|uniref:Myb-like domain-containing protein n=1 Tax=Trichomonascus ciferrii TaxID=44093 RepID=A0A642V7L3_9ASCO|nr:hypothetical protein TRICI_002079 [Trichomonascus ciferrii]
MNTAHDWDPHGAGAGAALFTHTYAYTYDVPPHPVAADLGLDYSSLCDYGPLGGHGGFSFDDATALYATNATAATGDFVATAAPEDLSTSSSPSPGEGTTRRSSVTSTGSGISNTHRAKFSPKPKFTAEDDSLLIELNENRKMTWRQIAEYFDGRTAGALQVRYCTKLKPRTGSWTDQDIAGLKKAVDDYELERWNVVAQKLGNKFSPQACRDKLKQLQLDDPAEPLEHPPDSTPM